MIAPRSAMITAFAVAAFLCALRNINTSHRHLRAAADHTGGADLSGRLSHRPIDIVYTWVNGASAARGGSARHDLRGRHGRDLCAYEACPPLESAG